MIRINHPKYLRVILPAILISASLFLFSCNNDSTTEKTSTDTSKIKADTIKVKDSMDMPIDTVKEKPKGEQTPPPK
jgi:hypothetical protein